MDSIERTVEIFGRQIDIEDLRFNGHKVICLDIDEIGKLFIERLKNGILVYLAMSIAAHDNDRLITALKLCHFKERFPVSVSAGHIASNRTLLLIIRFSDEDFSLPSLDMATELLFFLYEEITRN